MATTVGSFAATPVSMRAASGAWINYAVLFAATSAVVGVIWDISWHRTIGRDTFWTPAHMAIYLSGIVAGSTCGWLVLRTTFFGSPDERAAGVTFWGFRGPLGAWLCIWGAIAMIVSAPFDNWWHNAYGLDVQVLSPPHSLLALGFTAIELGALLFLVARQNRVADRRDRGSAATRSLPILVAYGMGVLLCNFYIMGFEYIAFPNDMHKGTFYIIGSAVFPLILVAAARASRLRWPATTAAAVYMLIHLLMIWILPLFAATPKLAPIYNPVTHMVPPPFPILMVVPALAIDLVVHRFRGANDWVRALAAAAAFVLTFAVTQWFFAIFLISPASENPIFGIQRWNYNSRVGAWVHEFWDPETSPVTAATFAVALALAFISGRIGLWWGQWMTRVVR
jgi:hypothetical protein